MSTTYLAHIYHNVYSVSPLGRYWIPKKGERVILDESCGKIRVWPDVGSGPEGMEVSYRWPTDDHIKAAELTQKHFKRKAWWLL